MARRFLGQEELNLWQTVMRDVVPLKNCFSKKNYSQATKKEIALVEDRDIQPVLKVTKEPGLKKGFGGGTSVRHRHHELFVGVRNPGLDDTQWRKLARGKITVESRLDLHGYSVHEAFDQFISFMARARAGHWRCVEIITGLGSGEKGGMIRRELPLWLQRRDISSFILAVVHPHQGNQGSVRVLLRRNKR